MFYGKRKTRFFYEQAIRLSIVSLRKCYVAQEIWQTFLVSRKDDFARKVIPMLPWDTMRSNIVWYL